VPDLKKTGVVMARVKGQRKAEILQALAHMLLTSPGSRITTAKLAAEVGVSEAALYRHFPSKAKIFEGLIEFIEETIFTRINIILNESKNTIERIEDILELILTFSEKQPGMCRILIGDVLSGENERLRQRIAQFFDRLHMQIKQVLREAPVIDQQVIHGDHAMITELLLAFVEGRINQYVRSEFKRKPTESWAEQWQFIKPNLFD
jgi:TetR/AcrR family transcriptional regulator